jgi:hypothetical protein
MAIFLTLGVFLRPVVYFYAEKICTDTFDPEELERINALIGKQRDDVRTVWVELKEWKKKLPDGASVDIVAFKAYVRSRHPEDDISDGAFAFVFGGEKHREEVIIVSAELKEVREDLLAGTLSFDAFKADVLSRHPHISDGVFAFVFGGEKHRNDVKTVSIELKEAKSKAAASGQTVANTTALAQIKSDKSGLEGAVNTLNALAKIHDDEYIISTAINEMKRSDPNTTYNDITNCIMKLHVSSTTKHTAIMKRHPLHAKMTSFQKQIRRLNKECIFSNIPRSTHECSKCGGEITYFGDTSSMGATGIACLSCKRTGPLDKTVNTISDKRTSFKCRSSSTTFCSIEEVEDEAEQLKEEYKRESLELERLLERSSVQAQNDDQDLTAIVTKSVTVQVRVGGVGDKDENRKRKRLMEDMAPTARYTAAASESPEDKIRREIRRLEKEQREDKLVKIEDMYNVNDFKDPFPFLS